MFLDRRIESYVDRVRQTAPVSLRLVLWSGASYDLGPRPSVTLRIPEPGAAAVLLNPDFSKLGEAYIDGRIVVEGPVLQAMEAADGLVRGGRRGAARWARLRRAVRHSRSQDAKAISHHYDVSNEFYALFLDRNMTYSCGYFPEGSEELDTAQEHKFDHICRKLMLRTGERMLDIGCGWGGLILWAARHYGVDATGITLSREQFDLARERIAEAGLADRCRVELLDYRDVPEDRPFDKIASVGMFEHVGLRNLAEYFSKIHRLLASSGLVLNHGITTMDPQSRAVGMGAGEFIDRHIFPHGELPHLSLALREMSAVNLEAIDVESLRFHYARTLQLWATRLEQAGNRAVEMVGERRYRTWLIYLAGCAHAFAQGWISLHQILAAKADRPGMTPVPWSRRGMYA